MAGALPDRALVGAREEIELIRATDHRRLQVALDRKRLRTEGEQPMGLDRFRLALELQRLERLDLDRITREPVGHVTDEDLPRLRDLLKAGGDVDGVARGQPLLSAGDDFAGRDADAGLEAEPGKGLAHLDCGT